MITARITLRVAEKTIEGEHRQRRWEKQSAAYEEAVKEALARRTRREALTGRGDVGNIGSLPTEELRKSEEPESTRIRVALRTYASEAVWTAYEAADRANTVFWTNLGKLASAQLAGQWRTEGQQAAEREDHLPPDPDYEGALEAMYESRSNARSADEALCDVINRDLGYRPAGRVMARLVPRRRAPARRAVTTR